MEQKPTIGRIVHFYPKQECITPETMEKYASIISQVNENGTVELMTVGPNSIYFQHGISFSSSPKHGHWSWPPRG